MSSTGDDSWHSAVIQGYGDDLDAKVNTVEIKGGTISNAKGVAIYIPNLGTYNISGGTIEGSTALYAKAGNITITGGTFTGQQTAISTYAYYSDGWIETGEAVVFDSCGYAGSNSNTFTATINSGTFGTAKGTTTTKAIGSYTRNGNQKVTVSGDAMSSNSDLVNYADYTVYVNDGYDTDSVGKKVYYFTSLNLKNNSDDCSLYVLSERAILVATYKEVTDNSSSKLYEISYTYNKTTENNSEKVAETFLVKVNNTNHTFEYVSNETYQCYVTSTSNTSKKVYYDTLQGAVNGSLSGESITLTGDIKLVGDSIDFIAQSTVKNLTLNLGGHSLKDSAVTKYNEIIYVQGYNLTVENGTIESDYNAIVFDVNLQQSKGMTATLTLRDNLIVKNNCAGNCVFMKGTGANLVTSARLYSSCSDDKISSNNKAVVQINGSKTTEGKGEYAIGSITVDGGEIVNSNGAEAMYLPNAGTFNINAGTIKGAGAIYAKCGILNIGTKNGTTQPTFISTKTDKTPYSFNGNGCNATGDVIVVDSCGYPAGVPTINVYGGTFKVVKNNGEVTPESLGLDSVAVYNNFKKSGNQKATVNNQSNSINVAVYDVVNSLETEVMGKVNANDTVVLYDNIDLGNGHIEINKKVTFDLNGKTLTGNGASGVFEVVYGGDLTITGNGYVVAKAGNGTTVGATTGTIWAMAVWAYGGKVTIENGSFSNQTCDGQKIGQGNSEQNTQTPDNLDLIYAKDDEKGNKSTIIIKGGTFNCVQKMWTLNIKNTSKSTIKVTGGTFIGFNPDSTDNGGALNSADVQATQKEYFTESGYKSQLVSGSNSNYEVVPNTTNSNSDNA